MSLPQYTRLENIQFALDDIRETLAIWRDAKDNDDPYIVKLHAEFDDLIVQKQRMIERVVPFTAVYRTKAGVIIGERTYYSGTILDAEGLALADAHMVNTEAGQPAATVTLHSLTEVSTLNVDVVPEQPAECVIECYEPHCPYTHSDS